MDRKNPIMAEQLRRALHVFIPSAVFIVLITIGIVSHRVNESSDQLQLAAQTNVKRATEFASSEFHSLLGDLFSLAKDHSLGDVVLAGDSARKTETQKRFLLFSMEKNSYDQVRVLSADGKEFIRINNKGNVSVSVPDHQLQNKKDRYYFTKALALSHGRYYVSRLDLNVEHGKVEEPLNPTVRLATPIFASSGQKAGVLILNYRAQKLLNTIRELLPGDDVSFPLLLDHEGYYLIGPSAEEEWGFMTGKKPRFHLSFPQARRNLQSGSKGQFEIDDTLFTFHKVQLGDKRLTIVSKTDLEAVHLAAIAGQIDVIFFSILLIFVTAVASFGIAGRKIVKAHLLSSEKKLSDFQETAVEWFWETDENLRFSEISYRLKEISDINGDEYIGKPFHDLLRIDKEQKNYQANLERLKTRQPIHRTLFCLENNLGGQLLFRVSAKPLFAGKTFRGYRGTCQDATDYQSLNAELQNRIVALEIAKKNSAAYSQKLAEAQRISNMGSWSFDAVSGIAEWSEQIYRIFGMTEQELGTDFVRYLDAIHEDHRLKIVKKRAKFWRNGLPYSLEYKIIRSIDGEERWVQERCEHELDAKGEIIHSDGTIQDITERRQATRLLSQSEQDFRNVFNTVGDGLILHNLDGQIMEVNQPICDRLLYSREEFLTMTPADICSSEHAIELPQRISDLLRKGEMCFETVHVAKEGMKIPTEINSRVIDYRGERVILSSARDITERKTAEDRIRKLANTDGLTNLANRRYFNKKFDEILAYSQRYGQKVGLLMIDLDYFKPINDQYGHQIGDSTLQKVAEILLHNTRKSDMVARLGGDEFALLASAPSEKFDLQVPAGRIVEALNSPLEVLGHTIKISASIGIAVYPDSGAHRNELIRKADIALYSVKSRGRCDYLFYDPTLEKHATTMIASLPYDEIPETTETMTSYSPGRTSDY